MSNHDINALLQSAAYTNKINTSCFLALLFKGLFLPLNYI